MIVSETRSSLLKSLGHARADGFTLGLVPTMGYLHEGHLSLVDLARERADFVAASIFVNPLQFGPGEDLARYPRNVERDLSLLRGRGADLVFVPSVPEMYPDGEPQITLNPGPMERTLCGRHRPGHFAGVLTVVARLFGLFRPQVSIFGQKDYQQAVLVRRMVRDLEMDVEVVLGPIIREEDGLAMSSRNALLSSEERAQAVGLSRALKRVQALFFEGVRSEARLMDGLTGELERYPFLRQQYGEIVHPETLENLEEVTAGSVVLVAAHCGRTRLIDNHVLTL